MSWHRLIGFVLMFSSSALYAGSIDLNLSDDAARFTFGWPVAEDRLDIDASWLHHQDNGDIAGLGLHLVGDATSGARPLKAGVGGRAYYLNAETADGYTLALGGFLSYRLPHAERVGLGGGLYFAPDVLAFGDAESYREIALRVSFDILADADVYVGYRHVKTEFEGGADVTFDSDLHFGLRLSF